MGLAVLSVRANAPHILGPRWGEEAQNRDFGSRGKHRTAVICVPLVAEHVERGLARIGGGGTQLFLDHQQPVVPLATRSERLSERS